MTNLGTATGQVNINTIGIENAAVSIRRAGTGLVAFGGLLTGGLVAATSAAAGFETRISELRAVTAAGEDQITLLRDAALDLGNKGPFGPKEVADAFVELAKAGITAEEIINGVGVATINLAKAGDLPIARAAEIASNTMRTFGLTIQDTAKIADILVGASNASTINIDDLATSLKYVGAVAKAQGITLNDTATALAELGNAGIKGSTGGTVLRRILLELNPTTKPAIKALKDLGIIAEDGSNAFFDEAGNAKDLGTIFQILKEHTNDLTRAQKVQVLETVFGARAVAGALHLVEGGAEAFSAMEAEIGKSDAATAAAARLDNLEGSIRKFKAAVETFLVESGSPFLDALQKIVDGATKLVQALDKVPTPIITITLLLLAMLGAISIISGTILLTIFPILALANALRGLPIAFQAISAAMTIFRAATVGAFLTSISSMLSATVSFNFVLGATAVTITTTVGVILAIIAVIALLAIGFVILYKKSETFRRGIHAIGNFFQDLPGNIVDAWLVLAGFFDRLWDGILRGAKAVLDWMRSNWDIILTILTGPFGAAVLIIRRFGDDILNFLKEIPGFFGDVASAIGGFFAALPGKVASAVTGFIGDTSSALADWATNMLETVVKVMSQIPSKVAYSLGFVLGKIARILVLMPYYMVKYGKEFLEAAISFAAKAVTIIVFQMKNLAAKALGELIALPGRIRNLLIQIVKHAIQFAADFVRVAVNLGKSFLNFIVDGLKALPGLVKDIFTQVLQTVVTAATSIFNNLVAIGKNIANAVVEGIKNIPGQIFNIFDSARKHVINFSVDIFNDAKHFAAELVRGVVEGIKALPDLIWEAFKKGLDKIKSGFKSAFDTAKGWAGSLWEGFKDGAGIKSPSYIEKATTAMVENVKKDFAQLKKEAHSVGAAMAPVVTPQKGVGGVGVSNNNTAIGATNTINIFNPERQAAEDSLFNTMLKVSYLGLGA